MRTTIEAQLMKYGKSVNWLASRLKVAYNSIQNWMNGTRPQSDTLIRRCADLLLCDPADLWPEIKEPTDWEHRYEVLLDRISQLHYRDDAEEFTRLCGELGAASCHIYAATKPRMPITSFADDYVTPREIKYY